MLTGHIDESGNSRLFTLCCLVGDGSMWLWIEMAWTKLLEETNTSLRAHGRPNISRYHASDCRNLRREFAGWSPDEQRDFTQKILRIFQRHPLHVFAYSIDAGPRGRNSRNETEPSRIRLRSALKSFDDCHGRYARPLSERPNSPHS